MNQKLDDLVGKHLMHCYNAFQDDLEIADDTMDSLVSEILPDDYLSDYVDGIQADGKNDMSTDKYIHKYHPKLFKAFMKANDIACDWDAAGENRIGGGYVMNNYRWHDFLEKKKNALDDALNNYTDILNTLY